MDTLIEQQILTDLRELDPFSQRELLDFLAFLRYRQPPTPLPVALKPATTNAYEIYARLLLEEEQATTSRHPKKTPTEIRQLLAATRGSLPGKKSKDEIDREMRLMREEWVRE